MSGFLRRLVERHATEPATRPRALSRFEAGAPPVAGPPRELSVPASLPEDPPPAPVRGTAGLPADPLPAPAGVRDRQGEPSPASPELPPREAALGRTGEPFESTNAGLPRAPREALADPAQAIGTPVDLTGPPPPSRGVGLIVPRKALVAVRAEVPAAGPSRRAADDAAREPDVVRVHIGRVEVRAVLPSAGRPMPKPPAAAGPLSLESYLARGGRP